MSGSRIGPGLRTLVLSLAILLSPCLADASLRGIEPTLLSQYKSALKLGTFTCLKSNQTIPSSRINDDYCDCVDGSDEPGTSACSDGTFYCRNRGFESRVLASPFVDDGICDCCDGSDEPAGKCENTCMELGQKKREALSVQLKSAEEGLLKRAQYAQEAAELILSWQREADALKVEVAKLEIVFSTANEKKDRLQQEQNDLQTKKEALEKELSSSGQQSQTGSDDVAAGSVGEVDNVLTDVEEIPQSPEETVLEAEVALEAGEDAGTLPPILHGEEEEMEGQKSEENSGTEPWGTLYRKGRLVLLSKLRALLPFPVAEKGPQAPVSSPEMEKLVTELEAKKADVKEATKTSSAASAKVEESRRTLSDVEAKLGRVTSGEYGPENAWAVLDGKCFEATVGKYTYEMCPYGQAKQREASKGNGGTPLGTWSGFSAEGASTFAFKGGSHCWNGPSRSLKVSYFCGPEDKLSDLDEPSICEYTGAFETPAACDVESVNQAKAALTKLDAADPIVETPAVHDEL